MIRAALLAVLTMTVAEASTVTFCDVCAGYTVSKRGNDVLIRCPGQPVDRPWMTFKDCRNPRVTRAAGSLAISCG